MISKRAIGDAILQLIRDIEKRNRIELPSIDFLYSDKVRHVIRIPASDLSLAMSLDEFKHGLNTYGLGRYERSQIDPTAYAIVFPRTYLRSPAKLFAAKCEEIGHVVGDIIGVKDPILKETAAIICRFKGLLIGAREGLFPVAESLDKIQQEVEYSRFETQRRFALMKTCPDLQFPSQSVYERAMAVLARYLSNLHDQDLKDLIEDFDEIIDDAVEKR